MDMATALAHGTLRAAIPGLRVENLGEWRGELNLMLPKDTVTAYGTAKLAALNHDWSKALGIGWHRRIPLGNAKRICSAAPRNGIRCNALLDIDWWHHENHKTAK
jgi:hypothetical protein